MLAHKREIIQDFTLFIIGWLEARKTYTSQLTSLRRVAELWYFAGDPFAILEGLDHPAQVPVPLPQAGSKPVLDLDALYGGGYGAQLPPIQQASQADPFGLGGLAAPKPAASYETPRQSAGLHSFFQRFITFGGKSVRSPTCISDS